jgi:hypothetical protein
LLSIEKIKENMDIIEKRENMSYDDKVIGRKKKEVISEEHSLGSGEHSGGFKNVSTAIMDELSIIDSSSALYRELAIAILNNDEDRQALLDSRGFQSVVEAERYIYII